jgi:hypothetical protein
MTGIMAQTPEEADGGQVYAGLEHGEHGRHVAHVGGDPLPIGQ